MIGWRLFFFRNGYFHRIAVRSLTLFNMRFTPRLHYITLSDGAPLYLGSRCIIPFFNADGGEDLRLGTLCHHPSLGFSVLTLDNVLMLVVTCSADLIDDAVELRDIVRCSYVNEGEL